MLSLSTEEMACVRALRNLGALKEVSLEKLFGVCRSAMIVCPDGHQLPELYEHHAKICQGEEEPMHHPLALNGGAMLLAQESPLLIQKDGTYVPDGEVLLRHLEMAIKLKQPQAVILYAHAPCGMARTHGLTIDQQVDLLIRGKRRVREYVEPLGIRDVRAWLHICYEPDRRRTYHVERRTWESLSLTDLKGAGLCNDVTD